MKIDSDGYNRFWFWLAKKIGLIIWWTGIIGMQF